MHLDDYQFARSLNQYADHAPSLFLDYCCFDAQLAQFALLHGHVCKDVNACPNVKKLNCQGKSLSLHVPNNKHSTYRLTTSLPSK